ncbi:hypothetical protein N665_0306s0011 [Sinapis alba]|nr:hypothetical protein N665_0306s0011 [Sinapis alba]
MFRIIVSLRIPKRIANIFKQPWRNKRRRERSSRHDIRSQTKHIPIDLTFEILSRLPAKSILRFRCVSKQWSSLTRLPSFINSFASRSPSRRPRLLVNFSSGGKQYVISFPQHQSPDGSYHDPFYTFQIKNPNDMSYAPRSKSVEGLILLPGFRIWNPTLRQFSALPHPNEHPSKCYLGYDPLECKHKVLCIVDKEYSEELQVITLGCKESWRVITKERCPMHSPTGGRGRCFNGILYYKARLLGDDKNIIMSFDVKSESFSPIKYPEGPSRLVFDIIQGRLAMVTFCFFSNVVDLYILKDADGHEWTHQRFSNVIGKSKLRMKPVYFKGITDDGELVFAPNTLPEPYYIIYFDPTKNSIREAFFQGVKGEIRRRLGSYIYYYDRVVFPNHIESLLSL